jgi:hypothetical protein
MGAAIPEVRGTGMSESGRFEGYEKREMDDNAET